MKCEQCKFFYGIVEHPSGREVSECHRYPPTLTGNVETDYYSGWPDVGANDWCGEFKKIPATKAKPESDYPDWFNLTWGDYPKRNGANSKKNAFQAINARVQEEKRKPVKDPTQIIRDMRNGVRRYHDWCKATNKIGTEFVMQAATFFGPSRHWENDWEVAEKSVTITERNCVEEGAKMDIEPQPGESTAAFIARVQRALCN